jgi:OOP family OmpA-OmpF porin
VAGVEDPATQLDIVASNGVIHAIDRVLLPPGFEPPAPVAPNVTATYRDGRLVVAGVVDETQQAQLLAAADDGIDPANVIDELVIDAPGAPAAVDVDRLAVVVEAMPSNLVSGTATLDGASLRLDGVVRNDDARLALDELAVNTDVTVALVARPVADEAAADALEDELNSFVSENPILFEPSSVVLSPGSNAIVEQIAARARRLDGVDVVVVGHTDSDGTSDDNQLLSDGRAATVAAQLIELGLDENDVSSEGRGASEPILDANGAEDKAASRRVEFVVAVQ